MRTSGGVQSARPPARRIPGPAPPRRTRPGWPPTLRILALPSYLHILGGDQPRCREAAHASFLSGSRTAATAVCRKGNASISAWRGPPTRLAASPARAARSNRLKPCASAAAERAWPLASITTRGTHHLAKCAGTGFVRSAPAVEYPITPSTTATSAPRRASNIPAGARGCIQCRIMAGRPATACSRVDEVRPALKA